MKIQQKKFSRLNGWQTLRDEHPDQNLCNFVLAFGSTEILSDPLIYSSIRDNYPQADILLSSTAGEIIDGRIQGTWKRVIKNNTVVVETVPFASLSKTKNRAVRDAVKRYSSFVSKEIESPGE